MREIDPVLEKARRSYSTAEIGEYCSVTSDSVLKWIHSGKLTAFRTPGGRYRVRSEDFREFLGRHGIPVIESFFAPQRAAPVALVVTEDETSRAILRRGLAATELGLEIEETQDGYEATFKIGRLRPRIVILDLQSSAIDGLAVCRAVRGDTESEACRLLALVPKTEERLFFELRLAGADACLSHPVRLPQLQRELARLLG